MKLEYMGVGGLPGEERRYIDCSTQLGSQYHEQTEAEFFAALNEGAIIDSPYVDYDTGSDILTVPDPSGEDLVYDFGAVRTAAATTVLPEGCEDRAYLELAETEGALVGASGASVPPLDLNLTNNGFVLATAHFAFAGDDCTAGGEPPNDAWLLPAEDLALAAGNSSAIQLPGSASPCDPGDFTGEIVITPVESNAMEVRLPVSLTVTP